MSRLARWRRLARRFMRTRPLRQSAAVVLATTALLTLLYVGLESVSLSNEQIVERDFGRFSSLTELDVPAAGAPGDPRVARAATAALARGGARDGMFLLESFDVRPAVEDPPPFTMFAEADWRSQPFPDRYTLVDGRWPAAPREAVVSAALAALVRDEQALDVLSGNEELRVVGHVEDRFGTSSAKILAAPGTWASFDGAALAKKYPALEATPRLLWSGAGEDRVAAELTRTWPSAAPDVRTRAAALTMQRRSWAARIPLAYRIPALVVPLLAVFTAFALNGRRLRRNIGMLRAIGVPARDATAAVTLAGSALCLIAALAGVALGVAVGVVARPLGQLFLTRPLSPFPDVADPVVRLTGTVLVACICASAGTLIAHRRSTPRSLLSALPRGPAAVNPRHALATACGGAAIWQLTLLENFQESLAFVATITAALALLTPEAVRAALRRAPATGPRRRLARRQMLVDSGRVSTAVALMTATLGPTLALTAVLASANASDEGSRQSLAAPGQVALVKVGGTALGAPNPDLVRRVVAGIAPPRPPIHVSFAATKSAYANVAGGYGDLMVVDSVADAVALSNGSLSAEQRRTLGQGGLLVWEHRGDTTRTVEVRYRGTGRVRRLTTLAAEGAFQRNWEQQVSALFLTATAKRLGLPVTRTTVVLTGVTDGQAREAERIARAAGYDSLQVQTYSAPEPAHVDPAYWLAIVGLGAVVLVAMLTVARAQATALRGYLAGLVAIGLTPRWARGVLGLELVVIVALSTALGLVIGFAPLIAAELRLPGATIAIPWLNLTAIVLLFVGSAALATWLATAKLRASERTRAPG